MPAPNQNLRIHNTYTLGSPPPTLGCPFCPRHFRSKGGHTQHIRAKHHIDGREPHGSNPSLPPSPVPSESTTPPSREEVNTANPDIDVEQPPFDLNSPPPDVYGDQLNEDLPPGEDVMERPDPLHPPDPLHRPCLMRSYHPKLDGELTRSAFKSISTLMMIICRENL